MIFLSRRRWRSLPRCVRSLLVLWDFKPLQVPSSMLMPFYKQLVRSSARDQPILSLCSLKVMTRRLLQKRGIHSLFSKLTVISKLKKYIKCFAVAIPIWCENILVKCSIYTKSWRSSNIRNVNFQMANFLTTTFSQYH